MQTLVKDVVECLEDVGLSQFYDYLVMGKFGLDFLRGCCS